MVCHHRRPPVQLVQKAKSEHATLEHARRYCTNLACSDLGSKKAQDEDRTFGEFRVLTGKLAEAKGNMVSVTDVRKRAAIEAVAPLEKPPEAQQSRSEAEALSTDPIARRAHGF